MHPKLFTVGGFTQHSYGLLVAVGFFLGLWMAVRLARRQGLDADRVFNLGVYMALVGFAGAKVLLVAADWAYFSAHPGQIFSLQSLQAGGVFYGGFLAAIMFAAWYVRRVGLPFLKVADAFAPGVSLGHAVGRLGCFAAGCCWGKPSSAPWAVIFRDPYAHEMFGVPLGIPIHPTQLYEAAAEGLIFLFLMWSWRRRAFDGQILSSYMALYGAARFLIEFFRDDPDRGFLLNGSLSTSQFIALFLVLLSAGLWWWKRQTPLVRPADGPRPAHG